MKLKKILFCALLGVLFTLFVNHSVEAEEQIQTITEFGEFDINENALHLVVEYKPSLEEVIEMMPEKLDVFLDGNKEPEEINVEWYCITQNYESSDDFYFQFSPMWDNEKYVLNEEINLLVDAPYIAVFFTNDESGISTYSVTGNSNEAVVYKYLTETLGYNSAAACGALANIQCESAFKPNNLENAYEKKLGYTDDSYTSAVDTGKYKNFVNDAAGYGLCQWTYRTRKQGLYNLAKSKGVSISNISMQLEYLKKELVGSSTGNYMKGIANTAEGAYKVGYYYCSVFEKPQQQGDEKSVARGNLARNTYWPEYGGKNGSSGNTTPSTPSTPPKPSTPSTPPKPSIKPFVDVPIDAWYASAVQYVYEKGIIVGDGNIFAPDDPTTRAMVAVILYRLSGSPKVTDYTMYDMFTDLPKERLWYSDAVAWALKEGVSTGDDVNMRYNPNAYVTREQLALFLWRYAKYTGEDVTVNKTDAELFGKTYVNEWAKEGFAWAVDSGLIKGSESVGADGQIQYDLLPQGKATRAQLARVLQRFLEERE